MMNVFASGNGQTFSAGMCKGTVRPGSFDEPLDYGAGGNMDDLFGQRYPASYKLPSLISVASTDQDDSLSCFSNYGS